MLRYLLLVSALLLVAPAALAQTPRLLADTNTRIAVREPVALDAVGDRFLVGISTDTDGRRVASVGAPGDVGRLLGNGFWGNAIPVGDDRTGDDRAVLLIDGEFWLSDGTKSGTHLLVGLNPGNVFAASAAHAVGDRVIIEMVDVTGETGGRYWSVGPEGRDQVELAIQGPIFVRGNEAFFARNRCELWKTDGTQLGTTVALRLEDTLAEPIEAPRCELFDLAGDQLLMVERQGAVAWSTDGSLEGTARVDHLAGGVEYGVVGQNIFFLKIDDEQGETELWVSDGTPENTNEIARFPGISKPRFTASLGTRFVFEIPGAQGLFTTDGTPEGTFQFVEFSRASSWPVLVDSTLFFVDQNLVMSTDGTENGTRQVTEFEPLPEARFRIRPYAVSSRGVAVVRDGSVELVAHGATESELLWPTRPVVTTNSAAINGFYTVGSSVFFGVENQAGVDFWRTDGTPAGTENLGQLGSADRVVSALPGDRTLLRGGPNYFAFDNADPTAVVAIGRPEFANGQFVMTETVIAGNDAAYLVLSTQQYPQDGTEPQARLVLAEFVGDEFQVISELEVPIDQTGPPLVWLENEDVVVQIQTERCVRQNWDGESWSAVGVGRRCLVRPPLFAGATTFEFARDGLYANGDGWERLWAGELTSATPAMVEGRVYFAGQSGAGEPVYLLASDGTRAGTEIVAGNFGEPTTFLAVGDAILWLASGVINGHRDGTEVFEVARAPGGFSRPSPRLAWTSGQLVFASLDSVAGFEPHSFPFERTIDGEIPDVPDGGSTGETNAGCGCSTGPNRDAAPLFLVVLFGAWRGVRRCRGNVRLQQNP